MILLLIKVTLCISTNIPRVTLLSNVKIYTMSNQKTKKIFYWIVTGLLTFELIDGALWDLNLSNKGYVFNLLKRLGYPQYLATILGISKLIAASIIISPKLLLAKEWAYAGLMILFVGATSSHLASGEGLMGALVPIIFACITIASWLLRPRERKINSI